MQLTVRARVQVVPLLAAHLALAVLAAVQGRHRRLLRLTVRRRWDRCALGRTVGERLVLLELGFELVLAVDLGLDERLEFGDLPREQCQSLIMRQGGPGGEAAPPE